MYFLFKEKVLLSFWHFDIKRYWGGDTVYGVVELNVASSDFKARAVRLFFHAFEHGKYSFFFFSTALNLKPKSQNFGFISGLFFNLELFLVFLSKKICPRNVFFTTKNRIARTFQVRKIELPK